jgi:D-galactose 1-dehydrogenase
VARIRLGLVGFGKIARDQHYPAIAADPTFSLDAIVAPAPLPDLAAPVFPDLQAMLDGVPLDAVAICTPPGPRHALARNCLEAGLHVLLEKPPGTTLGEIGDLQTRAAALGRSLFATWHSRFNDNVVEAAAITRREGIATLDIQWLEDVEKWHPGQAWIWQAGGFGVFDPGINALSIATLLCPEPLLVKGACLEMNAEGHQPEAATLHLATGGIESGIGARFDFRHTAGERWTIDIATNAGTRIALSGGGAGLSIDDGPTRDTANTEYAQIYARFAALIAGKASDVDTEPLRVVADALLMGERRTIR